MRRDADRRVRRHDVPDCGLGTGEVLASNPATVGPAAEAMNKVRPSGGRLPLHTLAVLDRFRRGSGVGVAVHVERAIPLGEHRLDRPAASAGPAT